LLAGAVLIGYQWLSFGNPFYPAQHYMPDVEYIEQGYHGFTWPQLDLLWKTVFGIRYGLFTSAPLLLLFFYIPAWYRKKNRFIGSLELHFIIIFVIAFFLFCAANQYGRIQFNTGVRHILPVTPFLFLLVANVFIKIPKIVAVLIAIISTYWSWCLAMYRDVEFGLGILESLIHITFEGFQLPWLNTLSRMGYVQKQPTVLPVFLVCGTLIGGIWIIKNPFKRMNCVKSLPEGRENI
jgi:hypothetical protein